MYVFVCVCACMHRCLWRPEGTPEEDIRSPGSGVLGSCKPPDVSFENNISILCKSSKHFQPLRCVCQSHRLGVRPLPPFKDTFEVSFN